MAENRFNRGGSQLRIERFRARYLVAADHPAPERVQARLDDSITAWLPRSLGAALAGALPETAADVWLIRRLHIDLDINVAWDRDALVRVVADRLADVLLATIRGGADCRDVVWFPDRAAYLASFLSDRADGRGDTWYYEAFEGLSLLPVSAALRTAVCEVPETGLAALRQLGPEVLRRVLVALTVQDARRVLDVLAAAGPAGEPARCLEMAYSAWQRLLNVPRAGEEARDSLQLYLAALAPGAVSGPPLRDAVRAVVRLDRRLRDAGPEERARLLSAIAGTDLAALYLAAGTADAEVLAPWRLARREWLREVVSTLATQVFGPAATVKTPTAAPERRDTPFGGAFFLLPIIDELPLDAATDGWPDAEKTPAAALARFLILVKCLGGPRAPAAFHDGLLRDLMGIAPEGSAQTLFEWQVDLSRGERERFLETLETWHAGRGAVALETQLLVRSAVEDRPVAVLIDSARGVWRQIVPDSLARPERVVRRLRHALSLVRPGSRLLCDPGFVAPLRSGFADHRVTAMGEVGPEEESEAQEIVTRLDHLRDDLAYLRFPPQLGIAGALDRVLSVAAQGVLRSFAWRLPGFSRSSLPYLHANFLNVPASLEEQPDRRVVLLGRPPLGVILNMTGLSRGTYRLGWLDERPFALFPEE
jgi:hypothetical protein